MGMSPRADHMHRSFGGGMVKGMAEGFAVYRSDVTTGQVAEGLTPGDETLSQFVRA